MRCLGALRVLAQAATANIGCVSAQQAITSGAAGLGTTLARRLHAAAGATPDVLVVGAGHNGLVAAALLARQGLNVEVYEEKDIVGGACRTEYPFTGKAAGLPQSTGAR